MKRAINTVCPGDLQTDHASAAGSITLTRDERYRRRIAWRTDQGDAFLLDLAESAYLPDGTGLVLEDGGIIVVRAAPEDLLQITAPDARTLLRIAWHIGNRHTPAEVTADAIYIQPDHVLEEMVGGLGGSTTTVCRPFEPEGGAYGGHGTLQKGHHHGQPAHVHSGDDV